MIIFNEIDITGFGSIIKNTKFNFNKPGLNIIRGKVGSGKTTLPSALTWVLFGKSLKERSQVQTWSELRPKDFKGTKVEINFTKSGKDYKIIRCDSFKGNIDIEGNKVKGNNNLFIIVNGKLQTKDRNKKQVQAKIESIIGYSYNLFKNSIVFGQRLKRIIEESGPDKKKILEEGFSIMFIEEVKDIEKEELTKLTSTYSEMISKIDRVDDIISKTKEQIDDSLENEKTFEKNRDNQIKEQLEQVKVYKDMLSKLKDKNASKYKKKIEKLNVKEKDIYTVIKKKTGIIESQNFFRQTINSKSLEVIEIKGIDKCPHCGSKEKFIKYAKKVEKENKKIQEEIASIKEKLIDTEKTEKEISSLESKISKLKKKRDNYEREIWAINKDKKQILNLKDNISKTLEKIDKLEKLKLELKSIKYKKELEKLEDERKILKSHIIKLKREIKIKNWLIKDPLSNNGIKAYMFNSLLRDLNNKLTEYSNILGFEIAFYIDLESGRKDFYQVIEKDGIIMPYEDLSGGQKQLVDTTIALAIHDVISSIRPTNLIFLDEPFESLGEPEVEIIEEIIETKAREKALYLITHKLTFNPLNSKDINVRLDKNKNTVIK